MPSNEEAQKLSIDLATPILLCPLCLWQNRVTQTGLKLSDYVIVLLLLLLYLYLFGMILHGWDAVLIWLCSAFVSTRMVYRLPLSLCVLSSSFRIYCFALPTLSYHMKNELSKRAKMFFYLIMHRNTSTAPDWFILQQCIYEIVHFRTIHHTSDVCRYSGAAFTQRPPNWGFEFGKRRLIERRTNKALLWYVFNKSIDIEIACRCTCKTEWSRWNSWCL